MFKQQYVCTKCDWRSPLTQADLPKEVAEMVEKKFRANPANASCPKCKGKLKQDITIDDNQ